MEPEQGKYGLWYVNNVGFATKEQALEYLRNGGSVFNAPPNAVEEAKRGAFAAPLIWAGIAAVGILSAGYALKGGDSMTKADKRCADSSWAWVMAQKYVRGHLSSPSSAVFPSRPIASEHIAGCAHAVVGEVEAKNAFGVTLKKRFSVTVTYSKEDDTWSGKDLMIQ